MRALRILLAFAVIACAVIAVVRIPIARYSCNVMEKRAEDSVRNAQSRADDFGRTSIANAALDRIQPCMSTMSDDWHAYYFAGELQKLAGRPEAALAAYQTALDLQHRADLYAAIGTLQLELRDERAFGNLKAAALYDQSSIEKLDTYLRMQLFSEFQQRRERLQRRAHTREEQPR